MKKSLLSAAIAVLAIVGAQAAVILEYDIAGLPGGVSTLAPSVNTVNGSNLVYSGNAANVNATLDGAIYVNNNAATPSAGADGFTFSTGANYNIDFTGGSLSFGASSVPAYSATLYANGASLGTQNFSGGVGNSDMVTYDLTSLGATTGAVDFKIVFAGDTAASYGLDSYVGGAANAARNVKLDVPTTPVPEPHEYAMIAGLCLVGFAVYRRRQAAQAETQA